MRPELRSGLISGLSVLVLVWGFSFTMTDTTAIIITRLGGTVFAAVTGIMVALAVTLSQGDDAPAPHAGESPEAREK